MRCFFIFAMATALAAGLSGTSWSQTSGGAAGGGGAAGAGSTTATSGGTNVTGAVPGGSATGTVPGGSPTGANPGGSPTGAVPGGSTTGILPPAGSAGTAGTASPAAQAETARQANGVNTFNGINRSPFFTDPGVRQQLNLNGAQYNALSRAYQNAYARYNQGIKNLNPNLTEQQREMQLQQLQAQFNQDLSGTVNSTFSNPQYLSRYNQLNRQFMGVDAFNDPAVRQQLNLTSDQVRQLRMLGNNWRQQLTQFRRTAGNDVSSPTNTALWNQLQLQYTSQLNGVLTPEQRQMWMQQTGQAYTFSPNTYFGTDQTGNIQLGVQPVVDPTVPKYFPTNGAATQGTQPQTATRPATTPATQGTQGGTVR